MLLEDDDVAIGNRLSVGGREDRGHALVDGLGAEGRCGHRQQRQEGQADEGTHDGWRRAGGGLAAKSGDGDGGRRTDKAIWQSTCDARNERDAVRGDGRRRSKEIGMLPMKLELDEQGTRMKEEDEGRGGDVAVDVVDVRRRAADGGERERW